MHSRRSLAACGFFVLALLILVGCKPAPPPLAKTYPVNGTVIQSGKPMKGGSIQFNSAADPMLRVVGVIKEDGTFTLNTAKDNATGAGAPAGEYQVIVQPPLAKEAGGGFDFAHKGVPPMTLPTTVRVEAKENNLKIEVP
jgi:hypothetical protein